VRAFVSVICCNLETAGLQLSLSAEERRAAKQKLGGLIQPYDIEVSSRRLPATMSGSVLRAFAARQSASTATEAFALLQLADYREQ